MGAGRELVDEKLGLISSSPSNDIDWTKLGLDFQDMDPKSLALYTEEPGEAFFPSNLGNFFLSQK